MHFFTIFVVTSNAIGGRMPTAIAHWFNISRNFVLMVCAIYKIFICQIQEGYDVTHLTSANGRP